MTASYAIPVRRASALPAASFRPRLAAAALAVRLTVPPAGRTNTKRPADSGPGVFIDKGRGAGQGTSMGTWPAMENSRVRVPEMDCMGCSPSIW